MKIYKIKWIDAISDSDWMTIEETKEWAKKNLKRKKKLELKRSKREQKS